MILVVDEAVGIRRTLCCLLRSEGYVAAGVDDTKLACKLLRNFEIKLIVMDVLRAEVDAGPFLDALQAHPRFRHIPILVFSAAEPPEVEAWLGMKPAHHLSKLAGIDEVLGAVSRLYPAPRTAAAIQRALRT